MASENGIQKLMRRNRELLLALKSTAGALRVAIQDMEENGMPNLGTFRRVCDEAYAAFEEKEPSQCSTGTNQ